QDYVLGTGVLHAAIGVVNAAGRRLALLQSDYQRCHAQLDIDPVGDRPAYDLARVAIQHSRQEDKPFKDNVGDLSDPGLIDSRHDLLGQQIGINLAIVIRIGGGNLETAPADG